MIPEGKLDDLMARGAKALDAVPPMADEVLRRISRLRAGKPPSNMTYRVPLRERIFLMSRTQKVAAAVLLALLLAATGWAAEKVVQSVIEGRAVQVKTKVVPGSIKTTSSGDGSTVTMMGTVTVESSVDAGITPFTREQRKELDTLVAQKKYKLIGTSETPLGTEHRYRFVFSDGAAKEWVFFLPLEEFESLADYRRKHDEYEARRQEAMQKALAKGHHRLVNIELITVHECVDVATGKAIRVQRIDLPDGRQIASAREVKPWVPSPTGESEETLYETTWQEHLDSIKAGRRKLLDAQVTKNFWYEMTLEDGSKTIFNYGGDAPLEKLKAPLQPVQPAPHDRPATAAPGK